MIFNEQETTTEIEIMGEYFIVYITFEKTCNGFKGDYDEPGWDPEFDITEIYIQWNNCEYDDPPKCEVTGKWFNVLCWNDDVRSAVLKEIERSESEW